MAEEETQEKSWWNKGIFGSYYTVGDLAIDAGIGVASIALTMTGVGAVGAAGMWTARGASLAMKARKVNKLMKAADKTADAAKAAKTAGNTRRATALEHKANRQLDKATKADDAVKATQAARPMLGEAVVEGTVGKVGKTAANMAKKPIRSAVKTTALGAGVSWVGSTALGSDKQKEEDLTSKFTDNAGNTTADNAGNGTDSARADSSATPRDPIERANQGGGIKDMFNSLTEWANENMDEHPFMSRIVLAVGSYLAIDTLTGGDNSFLSFMIAAAAVMMLPGFLKNMAEPDSSRTTNPQADANNTADETPKTNILGGNNQPLPVPGG